MPVSAIDVAMVLWGGIGIDIGDIILLTNRIRTRIEEHKRNNYNEKYHIGMREISRQRQEVTRFLYAMYSSSSPSPASDVSLLRYVGGRSYRQRDLPLVTGPQFSAAKLTSPRFEYSDLAVEFPAVTSEELADEVAKWEAAGLQLWDGTCYSLNTFDGSKLDFRGVSFLTYRATIASVLDELALALVDHEIAELAEQGFDLLPKRREFLGSIDAVLRTDKRICLGGANVLFTAKTDDEDIALIIQRRSRYVSDEPGSLSVVPKFFHECLIDPWEEVDIRYSFYREVYEELFGGEDSPGRKRFISPTFYLSLCPPVEELYCQTNHDFFATGLALDLLRGNYQLAYAAYVHDPAWWKENHRQIRVNWEVDNVVEPVIRISDERMLVDLINRQDWAPEAYFSFVEGLRALSARHPEDFREVDRLLPDVKYVGL